MTTTLHGIFGGTFDPIHNGHLAPLREVLASGALDGITYIPAANPPHRAPPVAAAEHRLAMTRIAVAGRSGVAVDGIELQRSSRSRLPSPAKSLPSYTIDTLHELQQRDRQKCFALIVGMDALRAFNTWHRWRELQREVHIIVLARDGNDASLPEWCEPVRVESINALTKTRAGNVALMNTATTPVSSTLIRARLKSGEDISALTPAGVCDYIRAHNLYAD